MNEIAKYRKPIELIDNLLWKPGYSIYLTDWCKGFLGAKLFTREGLSTNVEALYQEALLFWFAHHRDYFKRHEPVPDPPRLFHMQAAYKLVTSAPQYYLSENRIVALPPTKSTAAMLDWKRSPILRLIKYLAKERK